MTNGGLHCDLFGFVIIGVYLQFDYDVLFRGRGSTGCLLEMDDRRNAFYLIIIFIIIIIFKRSVQYLKGSGIVKGER